jgi:hypothetical protein
VTEIRHKVHEVAGNRPCARCRRGMSENMLHYFPEDGPFLVLCSPCVTAGWEFDDEGRPIFIPREFWIERDNEQREAQRQARAAVRPKAVRKKASTDG